MMEQNLKNHRKLTPAYHFVLVPLTVAGLIASCINLCRSMCSGDCLGAGLILCIFIIVGLGVGLMRTFSLRVQDRVIRSEENFRHFRLTGQPLPDGLRMSQVIALRFASDAEFPALTARALQEKMGNKAIKKEIKHWRADHFRI